jgi:hypothetical protein
MGDEEFEYMDWAAASAPAIVADRIRTIMQQIEDGRTPDPAHWPDVQTCEALMEDSEPVVALMAAQMLDLRCDCGIPLAAATQKRMGALLDTAPSLYWRNRA